MPMFSHSLGGLRTFATDFYVTDASVPPKPAPRCENFRLMHVAALKSDIRRSHGERAACAVPGGGDLRPLVPNRVAQSLLLGFLRRRPGVPIAAETSAASAPGGLPCPAQPASEEGHQASNQRE